MLEQNSVFPRGVPLPTLKAAQSPQYVYIYTFVRIVSLYRILS